MSDVVLNILNKSFADLINSGYVAKLPYKFEATKLFGYQADDRTEIKAGQKYETNIIGRNNNIAFQTKEGNTDYQQNTLPSVETFDQKYCRYTEACRWNDTDDSLVDDEVRKAGSLATYGMERILENAKLQTPRQMIDALYRAFDLTYWFGADNVAKIQQQQSNNQEANLTTIPTLQTANANGVIAVNGVFTHNKIERIASVNEYTPQNSDAVIQQLVDISSEMKKNCDFGINRIILPLNIADQSQKATATLAQKRFDVMLKEGLEREGERVEIIGSNTLYRFGIKCAIAFHYSEEDYDRVCHCRVNRFKALYEKHFSNHMRVIEAPCGGFEVRIPDGIKIITGIKN